MIKSPVTTRRSFLKKAAYAAPAVMALGALSAPVSAFAKVSTSVLNLRSEIKTDRGDIKAIKSQIADLESKKYALTGKSSKDTHEAIETQIDDLKNKITAERADISSLRSKIKVIKNG